MTHFSTRIIRFGLFLVFALITAGSAYAELDAEAIGEAAGTTATTAADGVVRIGWLRTDVLVRVDGIRFRPQAGLGSWAAFKETEGGSMVMGDTVVFQDEVDDAMDAAFAGGLKVTALHNHFFYDRPKVYFMHIGGEGDPLNLAAGVKGMWDAIKALRARRPAPARGFEGASPREGTIDASVVESIVGALPSINNQVVKVSVAKEGSMHGTSVGGSMGLSSWAAFQGDDELAVMDGDFIMTAEEVQPTLRALRAHGIHIVALHNHMTGEEPAYFFTHFWGKASVADLARGFKAALDAN